MFWSNYQLIVTAHHAVVTRVLKDTRFGRGHAGPATGGTDGAGVAGNHLKPFIDFERRSMLELEPPAHTRLRGLVNRAFVTSAVDRLRPTSRAMCHRLIDEFVGDGRADLMTVYATAIPVIVIAKLLGFPVADAPKLLDWSHRMVAMYPFNRNLCVEDAAVSATVQFSDYVRFHLERRRTSPTSDLMSSLIAAGEAGQQLSEDELVTTIIPLLNAGHAATVNMIGNGVYKLIQMKRRGGETSHTTSRMLSTADVADAITEEVLRFDPPLHLFTRTAREPIALDGHAFAAGEKLVCCLREQIATITSTSLRIASIPRATWVQNARRNPSVSERAFTAASGRHSPALSSRSHSPCCSSACHNLT